MRKILSICAVLACSVASADVSKEVSPKASSKDFYVRGDLGAIKQANKMKSSPYENGTKFDRSPLYSLGVGYKLSENVRADLNIQYRNIDYKSTFDGVGTTQKTKNYTTFLNGYYDFNNSSVFTPYVTAGLGISRNVAGNATTSDGFVYKGNTTNNFAWNTGFGSKVKMTDSFDLDLGYRYVSLGKVKFNDASLIRRAGSASKLKFHEVTLGVVYNF